MSLTPSPLSIDLTQPHPAPQPVDLGLGSCVSPTGESVAADGTRLYRNDEPWIPVMGEIHYSRLPVSEWRDSLLKMKAGGIDVASAYVFWIHHEEIKGSWDWSESRNLAAFLRVCQEVGLLAVVRLGPWCHGEVRNGGFPDWIQNAEYWVEMGPFRNRDVLPGFMKDVSTLYGEIAKQLKGHLWKEGGPVVAVQVDNECWNLDYLHALKRLARDHGMDVPFTTMTGWNNVPLPESDLIPLFGGYADGFWVEDKPSMRKAFQFTPIRDDGDMGAVDGKIINLRPDRDELAARFPYLCCEIGGGMPSSYHNRLHLEPLDTAALALIKLGSGNNLPGYYMYHGGVNPEGRETHLNETRATGYPNDLPILNYDFEAPIGAAGQIREQWFLLRIQHQLLQRFGDQLSAMPAVFPERMPTSFADRETVRWTMRSDGERGFLFLCNHQRYEELPEHEGVQFAIKTLAGTKLVPQQPFTIPSGALAILPVSIDFSGVEVAYATCQPLGRLDLGGEVYEFFGQIAGIEPEFYFGNPLEDPVRVQPGRGIAVQRTDARGGLVHFVVLSSEDTARFCLVQVGDRTVASICPGAIFATTSDSIRIQITDEGSTALILFPGPKSVLQDGRELSSRVDGVFTEFMGISGEASFHVSVATVQPAGSGIGPATDELSWEHAAEYAIGLPKSAEGLLQIRYLGDSARVYSDGKLVLDNFWNGQPFELPLWRLSDQGKRSLTLKVLPMGCGGEGIMFDSSSSALKETGSDFPSATLFETGDLVLSVKF